MQTNPVKTFMRPLGQAMKVFLYQNQNKESALNELLASYQATPQPASNHTPGNLIFKDGYNHQCPISNPPNLDHKNKTDQVDLSQ